MTLLSRALREKVVIDERERPGIKYSAILAIVLVLTASSLVFVWSHVRLTELKYQIAKDISIKEGLLEENRKLKVEIASLKSPQRLEKIARERFGMTYPEKEQVVFLK